MSLSLRVMLLSSFIAGFIPVECAPTLQPIKLLSLNNHIFEASTIVHYRREVIQTLYCISF